ncbi:MAG TPA: hypothetical protein VN985_03700, partial [Candidatus Eisenbacteria bacterium]|nr:hypothetical protein [Candidatus Eisenbacteria bacterium]
GWLVEHHPELLDAELGLNEGSGGGLTVADDLSHIVEVDIGLGQKTYQSYRVTAHGRGGHSSMPRADLTRIIHRIAASKLARPVDYSFGRVRRGGRGLSLPKEPAADGNEAAARIC